MDIGTATVVSTSITTVGMVVIAVIGAWKDWRDKDRYAAEKVAEATRPLNKKISRLEKQVVSLGGDPYGPK
jgi:hypothetical protein